MGGTLTIRPGSGSEAASTARLAAGFNGSQSFGARGVYAFMCQRVWTCVLGVYAYTYLVMSLACNSLSRCRFMLETD